MNIPCAKQINYCPCSENPLANLSSEDPDYERFLRINYYPGTGNRPIKICEEGSLEDLANCDGDCNPLMEVCCTVPPNTCCAPRCDIPNPCPNPPCCKPSPCPDPIVYSSKQTVCSHCGYSYTIPAGVYRSYISQADADAKALSACEYRACNGPDGPGRSLIPSICTIFPVIYGYGQVSPVEKSTGENVTLTVFYYYFGSAPLTFTWYKDSIPYSVTTGATLTINNLLTDDSGDYMLSIRALGCSAVFSNVIRLNVTECSQAGSDVPIDFAFPPVNLGDFEVGINEFVYVGDFNPGQFTITYLGGAVKTPNNPCPDQFKLTGFSFSFSNLTDGVFLSQTAPCGDTVAEVEAKMVLPFNPPINYANHTGGSVGFNGITSPSGGSCGPPCPTFNLVYQETATVDFTRVEIEDWDTIKSDICNCPTITEDILLPAWDGILADLVYDGFQMLLDTNYPVGSITFNGVKEFGFSDVWGPISHATLIATYEPEWGVGIFASLDPTKMYWALEIWGYDSGGATVVPCWLGVKQYGSTVLGRYSVKSSCAGTPLCINLLPLP